MVTDLMIYTPMYVTAFWSIVLIAASSRKNRAKHFLGYFMFIAFLLYLSHALFFKKQYQAYLLMDSVYIFASLSVYPLYFWYIKLLTVETDIEYKNLKLLYPALLFSLASTCTYFFMNESMKMEYLQDFLIQRKDIFELSLLPKIQALLFVAVRIVFATQVIYFLVLGRKLVKNHNSRVKNFYSNLENKTIFWVKYLLYSFVITSFMSVIFNMVGRSVFLENNNLLFIPSFVFSMLLFFIGYLGYLQDNVLIEMETEEQQITTSNYSPGQKQLMEKLIELFEKEKIYTKNNLKITDLSTRLHTNRTYISGIINKEFNKSFNDFVNEYRIDDAKFLLSNYSPQKYSLEYISESTGFGSLNTFIRTFKKFEGVTPGNYRDNANAKKVE